VVTALGGHLSQVGNRLSAAADLRDNAASPAGDEKQ
jgi:hypothetical protein